MSRHTQLRFVQLVAIVVSCFFVSAFAQGAQSSNRLVRVQFAARNHRPAAAHGSGARSPVSAGNVRAKDDVGACWYTCDSEHGFCTCGYVPDPAGQGANCCALVCGICFFGSDLEN
jgi:hypothetical protein